MFRKYIFIIIVAFVFVSASISIAFIVLRFREAARMEKMFAYNIAGQRLGRIFSAMNDFPGSAGKDILFLHNLSSVQNMHATTSMMILPEVKDDFKNFLNNNDLYKDLFFFKKELDCAMRISSNSQNDKYSCEALSPFILEIIAQTGPLSSEEVYISPLLSYKDISPGEKDTPVILYITPVDINYSIISIVDANYFLEEFRRSTREGESVFLLDSNGYYLANSDRLKEKFSGGIGNFYSDFPDIPSGALSDDSIRVVETKDKFIIFGRIYPTESNFAIYEGANKIFGPKHEDEYFWVMAVVSDKGEKLWYENLFYIMTISIILIMHFSVLIFYSFLKLGNCRQKKIKKLFVKK